MLNIDIKLHHPLAKIPQHARPGDAGYDLIAAINSPQNIWPGQRVAVPSGISIHIGTPLYYAMVAPRSGLGKQGIILANTVGVIDSGYTGEIVNYLWNSGDNLFVLSPGDRVAQMVFMPVLHANWSQVEEHEETERGANGFGSTGLRASSL